MSRLWQIVHANNATFYDYGSNRKVSVAPRLAAFAIVAVICAALLNFDLKDFLNGIIPVQAILIGFSFSVMFFLVSSPGHANFGSGSIETGLKQERLSALSRELFHNLAYFNLAAIGCLVAALLLLIPNPAHQLDFWVSLLPPRAIPVVRESYIIAWPIGAFVIRWTLAFLVLESGFTFGRTVGRVNYLFEQKLKMELSSNPDESGPEARHA